MNTKVRRQLKKRKRNLRRRISVAQGVWQSPMIRPATTKLELSEKQQAITCGGLAAIMELIKTVDLRKHLNQTASTFKLHLPYDEADHIFNIALNLLAGGTCLDHIEHRRNDEAYLDAVGAERIPDPTTAGDFCRRFSQAQLTFVMQGINRARQALAELDLSPAELPSISRYVDVDRCQHPASAEVLTRTITRSRGQDAPVPPPRLTQESHRRCQTPITTNAARYAGRASHAQMPSVKTAENSNRSSL